MRSFRAKKSLLSRRYLRDPRPFWMDPRYWQRTYGNTALILFRTFATCCNVGTLENKKGFTALTHSIGCNKRKKIRVSNREAMLNYSAKNSFLVPCSITAPKQKHNNLIYFLRGHQIFVDSFTNSIPRTPKAIKTPPNWKFLSRLSCLKAVQLM